MCGKLIRKYCVFILLCCLPVIGQAYKDDYVWVEKFKKQLPLAESGDGKAQYAVASMYERGNGTEKDLKQAFKWYLKAASQGDDKAVFKVGYFYLKAVGTNEDFTEAYTWLNKAAQAGNERANYYIAYMYEKGKGVEQNLTVARQWYEKSSKGNYQPAADRLVEIDALLQEERVRVEEQQKAEALAKHRLNEPAKQPVPVYPVESNEPSARPSIKSVLLSGGWQKRDKPAEYLPSKFTSCTDKGATIECVSGKLRRNIGMADVHYTTKAILYGMHEDGNFKVSYRNNVVSVQVTDPEYLESGGKVPVQTGWQDAEHSLTCTVENKNELSCRKDKLRSVKFTRAE